MAGILDFLSGGNDTAPAASGTGGMGNLLTNKLFLQYLNAGGQDLLAGNPIGANVGAVTNQNIAAQNYMGTQKKTMAMLSKILGQSLGPDDTKATFSNKGVNLDIPTSTLKSGTFLSGDPLGDAGAVAPIKSTTDVAEPSNLLKLGSASPFVGSQVGDIDFTASDLAGLTTQDLGNIMSGALNVEQLKQKKVSDVADAMYKDAHRRLYESIIDEHKPVFSIPGTDIKLTRDEYLKYMTASKTKDERTAEIKNYEYAIENGFKGSFTEFKAGVEKDTGNMKDYNAAKEGGYTGSFHQWMLDMRKAGATKISLGEKLEEKKAMSGLKGQLYFDDPEWTKDLNKQVDTVTKDLWLTTPKDQIAAAVSREKIKFIEDKITAGGGAIQSYKWDTDGKSIIWTVKWPSGDTKNIKYGVK